MKQNHALQATQQIRSNTEGEGWRRGGKDRGVVEHRERE